jgi:Domain of unknown function (DUF1707)
MTWLDRLADQLAARGVTGKDRRRILAELQDHIDCEPGCESRLGDPQDLAASFADELATDRARRAALDVFVALALAAIALLVSQLTIAHAGGYPGFTHGLSLALFVPAAVGMFVASQVALVAGTLAALRAVRRRRARTLPAAETALIRRRAWIGLFGGLATVLGLELYVVDFSSVLPAWWLALVAGLAGVAGVALLAAAKRLVGAGAIIAGTGGPPGNVFDDVPSIDWRWLRRRPWRLGAIASLTVFLAMTLLGWHAEHSLIEGIERGVIEGLAAAAGFALLGRAIGVAGAARPTAELAWSDVTMTRLVADEDRSRAELVLRESFGHGRLSLAELTARVTAVHDARTIADLHAALSGLPEVR